MSVKAIRPGMVRAAALGALLGLAVLGGGCAYYPATPYPAAPSYGPSTFERSFDAALGAISDQGLRITVQDRAAGNIVGTRGALTVTATVRPQADGTTRVEFKTSGDQGADAGTSQRVLGAYNARMGR
ncbi:MAG: hypothetical protein ACRC2B_13195 [Rubrivivax sp.]